MKPNNFANPYESLLDNDPYFFDDYLDSDQRMDTFVHDSAFYPVERFFEVAPTVLSH